MSLPLDDVQANRNTFRNLCELASILRKELEDAGFHGEVQDKMVLTWWNSLIAGAFAPNFGDLLQSFFPKEE